MGTCRHKECWRFCIMPDSESGKEMFNLRTLYTKKYLEYLESIRDKTSSLVSLLNQDCELVLSPEFQFKIKVLVSKCQILDYDYYYDIYQNVTESDYNDIYQKEKKKIKGFNMCVLFKYIIEYTLPVCCEKTYRMTQNFVAFGIDGFQYLETLNNFKIYKISDSNVFIDIINYSYDICSLDIKCNDCNLIQSFREHFPNLFDWLSIGDLNIKLTNQLVRKVDSKFKPEAITTFHSPLLSINSTVIGSEKNKSTKHATVLQIVVKGIVVIQVLIKKYSYWDITFFLPKIKTFDVREAPAVLEFNLCNNNIFNTEKPWLPPEVVEHIISLLPEELDSVDTESNFIQLNSELKLHREIQNELILRRQIRKVIDNSFGFIV
jgi:hypothetical protein